MTVSTFTAVWLGFLAFLGEAPAPAPTTETPTVQTATVCELSRDPGDRHLIVATVQSNDPARGSFALLLESAGSNRISSSQGGVFSVQGGEPQQIAMARFDVGGQAVTGKLSIEINGQTTACALS